MFLFFFDFWIENRVSGTWEGLKKIRGGVALRCDKVSWRGEPWEASEKHLELPWCPEPCQLTKVVSLSNGIRYGIQKFIQFVNFTVGLGGGGRCHVNYYTTCSLAPRQGHERLQGPFINTVRTPTSQALFGESPS